MDYRSVPVEVLREFARTQAELSSIRTISEDAGIGRSTLHKFITAGTTPHPRVRRLLALWYLRRMSGLDELELVRPYVAALDVLFGDVADPARVRATRSVLDSVERAYAEVGEESPRWIEVLRTRLARMAGSAVLAWAT